MSTLNAWPQGRGRSDAAARTFLYALRRVVAGVGFSVGVTFPDGEKRPVVNQHNGFNQQAHTMHMQRALLYFTMNLLGCQMLKTTFGSPVYMDGLSNDILLA